jgi:hypothetical protein
VYIRGRVFTSLRCNNLICSINYLYSAIYLYHCTSRIVWGCLRWFLLIFLFFSQTQKRRVISASFVRNIKLLNVRIANHTVLGTSTKLECTYDLQGETLYSVKWYKDGDEFFRYLPKSVPKIQVFEKQGIYIDVSTSPMYVLKLLYLSGIAARMCVYKYILRWLRKKVPSNRFPFQKLFIIWHLIIKETIIINFVGYSKKTPLTVWWTVAEKH